MSECPNGHECLFSGKLFDAAEEIERLRAELAAERDANAVNQAAIERFRQHESELRAQLAEAREALEPMRWWNEKWDALTDGDIVSLRFYIEELRRARAVLEKIKGGGDECND